MERRVAVAVVSCGVVLAAASVGESRPRKRFKRHPEVLRVDTPLGTQSGKVIVPFSLVDLTGQPTEIEVQFGVDGNGDGNLAEDEFRPATEDRLDPRNSREDSFPQLFTTSVEGSTHGFVWNSSADLPAGRFLTTRYALTPQGRYLPDPDHPGLFLLDQGGSGVAIRMRTIVTVLKRKRKLRVAHLGAWMTTAPISLDNAHAPSMTIESVTPGSPALVAWTAYDPDSEDRNGNGVLDLVDGEDVDSDGTLDTGLVGVAFDYHYVGEGEDPSAMTDAQLSELAWFPCTRVEGVGDRDDLVVSGGTALGGLAPAAPSVGRHWVFAWDALLDAHGFQGPMILRATPFDETGAHGETLYSRIPVAAQ